MNGDTVRSMLLWALVVMGAVAGLTQAVRAQQSPVAAGTKPQGAPSAQPSAASPPAPASPPPSSQQSSPAEPPSGDAASATEQDDEAVPPPATTPSRPAAAKGSPQRFEPTEKVRPDFDVAFPVDI